MSSTDGSTGDPSHVIAEGQWQLHPRVRLRPERFGALAYHFDSRRLNFLRDHDLVRLVERLGDYPDIDAALAGEAIPLERRGAFLDALDALVAAEFLIPLAPPSSSSR